MKNIVLLVLVFCSKLFAFDTHLLLDSPFPKHKIEIMIQKSPHTNEQLLVFLHGSSEDGLKDISSYMLNLWLEKGFTVAAISMPGFGKSTGTPDFCGSFTLESLHYALDFLKEELNSKNFGLIAFEQGGLAATLLTTQRDDIQCLVCANGSYDLLRHNVPGDRLMHVLHQKGYDIDLADREELEARSPILLVEHIDTPIYLLHRKGTALITEGEVLDFYQAMRSAGRECFLTFKKENPEENLTDQEVLEDTEEWMETCMRTVCHCFSVL